MCISSAYYNLAMCILATYLWLLIIVLNSECPFLQGLEKQLYCTVQLLALVKKSAPTSLPESCFEHLKCLPLFLSFQLVAAQRNCLCAFKTAGFALLCSLCLLPQLSSRKLLKSVLANDLPFNYEEVCHFTNSFTHEGSPLVLHRLNLLSAALSAKGSAWNNAAGGGFPLPLTNAADQRTAAVRRLKKKMTMMIKQMLAVQ